MQSLPQHAGPHPLGPSPPRVRLLQGIQNEPFLRVQIRRSHLIEDAIVKVTNPHPPPKYPPNTHTAPPRPQSALPVFWCRGPLDSDALLDRSRHQATQARGGVGGGRCLVHSNPMARLNPPFPAALARRPCPPPARPRARRRSWTSLRTRSKSRCGSSLRGRRAWTRAGCRRSSSS